MRLRAKFNLVFVVLFLIGVAAAGLLSYRLVYDNAEEEVVRDAQRMMEFALAVRGYTTDQVKPHLEPLLATQFLPQTVPAFAATETLKRIADRYPGYSYKEATLNPTNPRNLPVDWERGVVNQFQLNGNVNELRGVVTTQHGSLFYVARPIQITNPACLACHSTPDIAPVSLVDKYGRVNGFGWALNDIVGAQVVTVPTSLPIEKAQRVFATFMGTLLAIFLVLFVALNWLLQRLVVSPVREMADVANRISQGDMRMDEFAESRKDEIGSLQHSFNRMRRSLTKAMALLRGNK